jgi:DNA polymerase III epsilon subunit-like protein
MSHKLNVVAGHLGIVFKHHDALEDARACALIAIKEQARAPGNSICKEMTKYGISFSTMQVLNSLPMNIAFQQKPSVKSSISSW